MPKNKGGSGFKKMAKSSFSNVEKYCQRTDYPGTEYMLVTKALGNLRFNGTMIVNDKKSPNRKMDGKQVLARVVGKLRKRRDRVNINDLVLVGIRDFCTRKEDKVDIVWIYRDKGNIRKLIRNGELTESQVLSGIDIKEEDCGVEFTESSAEDKQAMLEAIIEATPKEVGGKLVTQDFLDISDSSDDDDLLEYNQIVIEKRLTALKLKQKEEKATTFDGVNFDDI